jgi:hypothetical protein
MPVSKTGIPAGKSKGVEPVMNRRQKPPLHRLKNPAYRQAFERLDAALEENTPCNNIEKIQMLRLKLFGCVPGTMEIPK